MISEQKPETNTELFLNLALRVSVPVCIQEMRSWSEDARLNYMRGQLNRISVKKDNFLFRSSKEGEIMDLFVCLSYCIAGLSFNPGGVQMFGLSFETSEVI